MTTHPATLILPEYAHGSPFVNDDRERLMLPRNARQHARIDLAQAKAFQQKMSSRQGLRSCGYSPIGGASAVSLDLWTQANGSQFATTGNTQVCDSSLCITCAPGRDRKHREELEIYMAAHQATGGEVYALRVSLASTYQRTGGFYSQEVEFLRSQFYKDHRIAKAAGDEWYTRKRAEADFRIAHPRPNSWDTWGFVAQQEAFRVVKSQTIGREAGGAWSGRREKYNIIATTSNREIRVTPSSSGPGVNAYGRNWKMVKHNLHSVVFFFTERRLTAAEEAEFSSWLINRWVEKATEAKWKATKTGQYFTHLDTTTADARFRIASYQHKGASQQEQATRVKKTADHQAEDRHALAAQAFPTDRLSPRVNVDDTSYDPAQALADAMPSTAPDGTHYAGDPHALTYWHNYENAVKGANVVAWTPSARKVHGVQEQQQALAAERKAGRTKEALALVPTGEDFNALRAVPEALPRLLTLAENSESPAVDVASVLEESNVRNIISTPEEGTSQPVEWDTLKSSLLHQSTLKARSSRFKR